MALLEGEIPERRWDLTAPESGVLLWGPETRAGEALKLALLELVVRRALRLVSVPERRLVFFSKRTDVLVSGTLADQPAGRALRAALDVGPKLRNYPGGIVGAPVADWARAVVARYREHGGYVQAKVLPALEARGLFGREDYRRLGLFGATRWAVTPAGTATLADLRALLATGRGPLGGWLRSDPARAELFVERAGAALLLLPERFPEFRRLRGQATGTGGDGGTFVASADVFTLVALGEVFGPGGLDGIDAACAAIDAGVDSGGGGDGGDGE